MIVRNTKTIRVSLWEIDYKELKDFCLRNDVTISSVVRKSVRTTMENGLVMK